MMVQVFESKTKSFSIIISWDNEESGEVVDEYRIMTNTTDHFISTNTTTVVLEGEYNIPLQITLSAINCAGSSAEVTEQLIVGMCVIICSMMMMMKSPCLPQLAVLLPVHQSMAVLVSGAAPE